MTDFRDDPAFLRDEAKRQAALATGAMRDADRGRALVDRLFSFPRLHAECDEWEQAFAELRAWSMAAWDAPTRLAPDEAAENRRLTIERDDFCATRAKRLQEALDRIGHGATVYREFDRLASDEDRQR
jgi:hypothetical protein